MRLVHKQLANIISQKWDEKTIQNMRDRCAANGIPMPRLDFHGMVAGAIKGLLALRDATFATLIQQ